MEKFVEIERVKKLLVNAFVRGYTQASLDCMTNEEDINKRLEEFESRLYPKKHKKGSK